MSDNPQNHRSDAVSTAQAETAQISPESASGSTNSLTSSANRLCALLVTLIAAILSFHPWIMDMVAKACSIVPLLLLVVIFVYVVNPIVGKIMRLVRKLPERQWFSYHNALILTYLLLVLCLLVFACIAIPRIFSEMADLAQKVPAISHALDERVRFYRASYFDQLPVDMQDKALSMVGELGSWLVGVINGSLAYVGQISSAVVWFVGALVLVPLIGFYILSDGQELGQQLCDFLPMQHKKGILRFFSRVHVTMQKFLHGQMILCACIGGVIMVIMAFILPEYCVALGVVAGITEAIPMIGPILGALPAVAIALAIPDGGLQLALIVAACYLVVQQLEGNLLVPKIMGDSLGVHPLSLTLGMLVFGDMFGFWGVVFASPIVAVVKIACEELCRRNLEASRAERRALAEQGATDEEAH